MIYRSGCCGEGDDQKKDPWGFYSKAKVLAFLMCVYMQYFPLEMRIQPNFIDLFHIIA